MMTPSPPDKNPKWLIYLGFFLLWFGWVTLQVILMCWTSLLKPRHIWTMSLGHNADKPFNICFTAVELVCRAGAECDFEATNLTLAADSPRLFPAMKFVRIENYSTLIWVVPIGYVATINPWGLAKDWSNFLVAHAVFQRAPVRQWFPTVTRDDGPLLLVCDGLRTL